MSLNDPLANVLSNLLNAEKKAKPECVVRPASNIIKKVLQIMKQENYIEKFKVIEDGRGDAIQISLSKSINNCAVIKPRFNVKKDDYEKYEKRYLPASDFGFLVVSTSQGIMTQQEAKEKRLGGRLIMYCY